MIGDKREFVTLEIKEGGVVTFAGNGKGHIIGMGKVKITFSTFLENLLYVKRLKHNLISISQLCDKGFKVLLEASLCIVTDPVNDSIYSFH